MCRSNKREDCSKAGRTVSAAALIISAEMRCTASGRSRRGYANRAGQRDGQTRPLRHAHVTAMYWLALEPSYFLERLLRGLRYAASVTQGRVVGLNARGLGSSVG